MPEIDIGSPKSSIFSVGFLIAWSPSGGTGGTAGVPPNGRTAIEATAIRACLPSRARSPTHPPPDFALHGFSFGGRKVTAP